MRRLLWVGDAVAATGFARCTHAALDVLRETWEVTCLGINYWGDPHPYPYPIFPAARVGRGEDPFGQRRLAAVIEEVRPDCVVLLNDPWNIPGYARRIPKDMPVVGWLAVDGKNVRTHDMVSLDHAVFWTEFAEAEARRCGWQGSTGIVNLGCNTDLFRPRDRDEARATLGLPEEIRDRYLIGVVGRNQPRKRLDLTIAYFAEWLRNGGPDEAMLYMHVAPTGENACEVGQLAQYYGLSGVSAEQSETQGIPERRGHIFLVQPSDIGKGIPEEYLALTYASFDCQLTTTQGEGWGLCATEGMASAIAQIVPDWSALGDWPGDAVRKVPCSSVAHTNNGINAVGGIADRDETVKALDEFYRDPELRADYGRRGRALMEEPRFRWRAVGEAFAEEVERAMAAHGAAHEQEPTLEAATG